MGAENRNQVCLSGEVEIELRFEGEVFLGLGEIRVGGMVLRDGTWPLHPEIATDEGLRYTRMELLEIVPEGEAQVLRVKLLGGYGGAGPRIDWYRTMVSTVLPESPVEDLLEWRLAPVSQTIGGAEYRGLSYSYRFRSESRRIHRLLDWGTWEPGGEAAGNLLIYRGAFTPPEGHLTRQGRYTTSEEYGRSPRDLTHTYMQLRPRFGSLQCFDYQWNPRGSLLLAWERPEYVNGLAHKEAGSRWTQVVDEHWFPLTNDAEPPARWVLWRAADHAEELHEGRTQWMRCWQWSREHYGGQVDLPPRRPYLAYQVEAFPEADQPETALRIGEDFRDRILPRAAELGYNALYYGPRWECPGAAMCAPQAYRFAEKWGGEALIADICATGKRLGVKALPWLAGHIAIAWAAGELTREHPEWLVEDLHGGPYTGRYGEIASLDLNGPGGDYWFEQLRHHTEEVGVEAWFFDSYPNLGVMPVTFADPLRRPQLKRVLAFQAWCQQRGADWLIEGDGPFGIACSGMGGYGTATGEGAGSFHGNVAEDFVGERAYALLDGNLRSEERALEAGAVTPHDYFRSLAARGPICFSTSPWAPGLWQWVTDEVVGWHRAYRAVEGEMGEPSILPGDAGMSWRSEDGRTGVVWSFGRQDLPLGEPASVEDVLSGEETGGTEVLRLRPWRVYRLRYW